MFMLMIDSEMSVDMSLKIEVKMIPNDYIREEKGKRMERHARGLENLREF